MTKNKKQKILFITENYPPYVQGGSEISTSFIVDYASDSFETEVLTSRFQKKLWAINKTSVFPVYPIVYRKTYTLTGKIKRYKDILFYFWTFYRLTDEYILKNNPDLVHIIPNIYFTLPTILATFRRNIPMVIDVRNHLFTPSSTKTDENLSFLTLPFRFYDSLNLLILKLIIIHLIKSRKKVKIIAVSDYIRNQLVINGFPKNKISVVYNISTNQNTSKEKQIRNNTLIFAGRIVSYKGIWVLLDAFKKIPQNLISLVIVGEGNELVKVKDYIRKNHLLNVKLIGKKTNQEVQNLYKTSKIIVAPSIWEEPFGRFIQESYATLTPLITSKIGGISEGIKNNVTGILVPPNDSSALAKAIESLSTNKKLYGTIVNNLSKNQSRFSKETIGKERLDIYTELLSN